MRPCRWFFCYLPHWASPLWPRAKTPPATPVDLNTASAEELAQLPGIGPAAARAIVQFREKSGPFQRVDDLLAIRGITQRKLGQIKPYVKVMPNAPGKSAKPAKP